MNQIINLILNLPLIMKTYITKICLLYFIIGLFKINIVIVYIKLVM